MELLIFQKEKFDELYNCTYEIESVPIEKRRHVLLAYLPCLFALRDQWARSSCYKIMFYVAILDVIVLWITGFATGVFVVMGTVYCSMPTLMYVLGTIASAIWYAETFAAVLLAVNRCVEMAHLGLMEHLFGGNRAGIWLAVPSIYALVMITFTKPVMFTGIYCSWFFNPHIGYIEDVKGNFETLAHPVHNSLLLLSIITLYVIFVVLLISRRRVENQSKSQRMLFLQVFIISAVNASTAALYAYMQFVHSNETLMVIAQIGWLSCHGVPGLTYLTMNKTIRHESLRKLGFKFGHKIYSLGTHSRGGISAPHDVL
ncbi:serpentine type 7TM GPCR chemoreceptor srt domain-containing protein [Ditylenchus destructor]|uniref:Serpentine type 7TM GPCR chemoreceptor srt domain-containing protein n=1 Tax=Ditylenchus destructor TaxID=166010 RepID=A0AAD4MYQ1_9BILA|nr:serpentine type 7TM GPCR chemoreceptor srt domain-containing protein [Ditylenchus destructor]